MWHHEGYRTPFPAVRCSKGYGPKPSAADPAGHAGSGDARDGVPKSLRRSQSYRRSAQASASAQASESAQAPAPRKTGTKRGLKNSNALVKIVTHAPSGIGQTKKGRSKSSNGMGANIGGFYLKKTKKNKKE